MYKVKIYNKYQIRMILESDVVDFNNFSKADLVSFLQEAQAMIKELKENESNND